MKTKKPRNLKKKIAAVIFCQETTLTYNELFSAKYEDAFLLHTGLYVGEALRLMSESDKIFVKSFIEEHNYLLS